MEREKEREYMVVVEIVIKKYYLKKINCLRVHWWILGKKEKREEKKKKKERNLLGCLVGWIG